MEKYILGIDQGTTGTTALIIKIKPEKNEFEILAKETISFKQFYPNSGWVEHNLDQIWDSVRQSCVKAIADAGKKDEKFNSSRLNSIGITNQRETTAFFNRQSLKPIRQAIVWQCKRSVDICQKLSNQQSDQYILEQTGLRLDPYFSATKISWAIQNDTDVLRALNKEELAISTIDAYLVAKLSGGKSFATEPSNACRTLLFNLKTLNWDKHLLDFFNLQKIYNCLPEIKQSSDDFGTSFGLDFLPDGIPIQGILGDQQAALLGHGCLSPGEAKCTYGTGAFLLMQVGNSPIQSKHGLLSTVAWKIKGQTSYALEGSAFIAGAAVQFIRDRLEFVGSASETAALAADVVGAPEVYFVPALAGLGAPWWSPNSRGAFFGLTRATTKAQLVRASLEGMAFQVYDLLAAMEKDSIKSLKSIQVDGGASGNSILMQIQADLAQVEVIRPKNLETTALGACFAAALGANILTSVSQVKEIVEIGQKFSPSTSSTISGEQQTMLEGWHTAVKCVENFATFQAKL